MLTDAQGRPIYGPGPAGPGYGAPPWSSQHVEGFDAVEAVVPGGMIGLGILMLMGYGAYKITEGEDTSVRVGATTIALLAGVFGVSMAEKGGYFGEATSW